MKRFVASFCATTALLFGTHLAMASVPTDGLLFHAPFEKSLSAAMAKGIPDPNKKAGAISFGEGISGTAVVLKDSARLSWNINGNLTPRQGTVCLWLKPIGWDPLGHNSYNYFFNACLPGTPDGDKIQFMKLPGPMFYFMLGKEGSVQTLPASITDWKKEEWRFFTLSWEAGKVRFFVNGLPAGTIEIAEKDLPAMVGDSFYFSISEETALDELRVYDRALADTAVREIFLADSLKRPATPVAATAATAVTGTTAAAANEGSVRFKTTIPFLPGGGAAAVEKEGAGISGFLTIPQLSLATRQSSVALAYDRDNLYFSFTSPYEGPVKPENTEHDGNVWDLDSFEIFLVTAATELKPVYQLVFNVAGIQYENKDGDKAWNGAWNVTSKTADNMWRATAVIPFQTLGVAAPKAGDEWRFNIGRNLHNPDEFTNVTFNLAYGDSTRFGALLFGNERERVTVAQRLTAEKRETDIALTAAAAGDYTASWMVRKPAKRILDKRSLSSFDTLDGANLIEEAKTVSAKVGDALQFAFAKPLTAEGEYYSRVTVIGPAGLLFNQVIPFEVTKPFAVTLRPLCMDGKLQVAWELRDEAVQNFTLAATFTDRKGVVAATHQETIAQGSKGEFSLPLKLFPEAEYDVTVTAQGTFGTLSQKETFYSYLKAPWLGTAARMEAKHMVPPPWTPIEIEGDEVKTLCATLRFSNGPLPAQILAGAEPLLAGPVTLTVAGKGGAETLTPGKRKWGEKLDDKVSFRQPLAGKTFALDVTVATEFDGMSRYDVTIAPRGKQATLARLVLDIPIRPEYALLKYPFRGQRQTWSVLDLEGEVNAEWSDSFMPHLWVGNDERGISWFTETDELYSLTDEAKAIRLFRRDDVMVMRITMIDQPVELTAPRVYTFGLMATPSRPLAKNWFAVRFGGCASTTTKPMVSLGYTGGPAYHAKAGIPWPSLDPEKFKASLSHNPLIKNVVYCTSNGAGDNILEYRYYYQEWRNPSARDTWTFAMRGYYHDGICPRSASWRDFFIDSTEQAINEFGIDGLYYDFGTTQSCSAPLCGYERGGKRVPTYPVFADRELRKQLYILFYEHGKEPAFVLHNYSQMMAPIASFSTLMLDGESYQQRTGNVGSKVTSDYTQLLTVPRLRAMFGTQFATTPFFLPIFTAEDQKIPKLTRSLIAMTLPLGIQLWSFNCNIDEVNKVYAVQDTFGFATSDFFPAGRDEGYFTPAPADKNLLAGFWKKADGALLAVSNIGPTPWTGTIAVNTEKLFGKSFSAVTALDPYSKTTVTAEGTTLRLTIPAKDYVCFTVKPAP